MEPALEENTFLVRWNNTEGGISEGPLSVLWNLVESYKVDIFDVSLSRIAEDFLNFMKLSRDLSIELGAEFALMASNLVYLKSKALLPDPGFEDEDYEPALPPELIERLLEFKKYQKAAGRLKIFENIAAGVFTRESNQVVAEEETWLDVSLVDLISAFNRFIQSEEVEEIPEFVIDQKHSVADKIQEFQAKLEEKEEFNFEEMFTSENPEKMEVVVTFLAILEIVKSGIARAVQHSVFGNIKIIRS